MAVTAAQRHEEGRRAMEAGRHAEAVEHFRAAAKASRAGSRKAPSLACAAECSFYLGADADSDTLTICKLLEKLDPGRTAHIRGLVLSRQGKADEARLQFAAAADAGGPIGRVASTEMLRLAGR